MAASITLSASDLLDIRRVANARGGTNDGGSRADLAEQALRQSRRAASQAKSSLWPNTLAGMRRRKEEAKALALARAEEEAQALDAVMAEERLRERMAILRSANEYFSGQSDKVKALRNYQQRQADREANEANAALRARRSAAERAMEEQYHDTLMAEVAAGEAADAGGRAAMRVKSKVVAADLRVQVREAYQRKMEEQREEAERAAAIVADIQAQEREAEAGVRHRREHAAAATKAFALENIRMAQTRMDVGKAEGELDARVAGEKARQEGRVAQIKSILDTHQVEAQRKAKVISDLMAADYMSRQNTEDARVAAQVAEEEEREAAAIAKKKAAQLAMKNSILENIAAQKRGIVAGLKASQEEAAADNAVFLSKLSKMEAQERADYVSARERARDAQAAQLAQMADKKRTLETWRSVDATDALKADAAAQGGPLDKAFNDYADMVLQEEVAKYGSKGAQPVKRLVHKLNNKPLMANLRRM